MPRIDFLILANHAEIRDGLLYMLGGGWNRHIRGVDATGAVTPAHFGIVVGVVFDEGDASQAHLVVRVEADDGASVVVAEGDINIPDGTAPPTKLVMLTLNANVVWGKAGTYHLRGTIEPATQPEKRFTFVVVDQP